MKKLKLSQAIALITFGALSFNAAAEADNKYALGLSTGVTGYSDVAGANFSAGTHMGVSFGYHFTDTFSVDLELMDGDVGVSYLGGAAETDADVDSLGVFASFRSSGTWYFHGKLGYVQTDLGGVDTENDFGFGLGMGFKFGSRFELDLPTYTNVDDLYLISLQGRVRF